jgi:hypothetical protein
MEHSTRYIPKMGDEVTALGHSGVFVVIAVHTEPEWADLQLTSPRTFILSRIPWGALKPLKKTAEHS